MHTFYSAQLGMPLINGRNLIPGDYVYLEVEDTGSGIDINTMSEIFNPFFTTKSNGRGLGLATILKTVQAHHGAINLKSELGKGTTFTIYFPAFKMDLNLH